MSGLRTHIPRGLVDETIENQKSGGLYGIGGSKARWTYGREFMKKEAEDW
jgi:hypothetical protein